jgi:hypothetical protein
MSIPINIDDPKMGLLQNHVYREKRRQDQKVKLWWDTIREITLVNWHWLMMLHELPPWQRSQNAKLFPSIVKVSRGCWESLKTSCIEGKLSTPTLAHDCTLNNHFTCLQNCISSFIFFNYCNFSSVWTICITRPLLYYMDNKLTLPQF